MGRLLIGCIRVYQVILSPVFGRRCRFYPTCSAYAVEAIAKKGAVIGTLMACWRILRCNPLHPGGYDPVDKDTAAAPGRREDGGGEGH